MVFATRHTVDPGSVRLSVLEKAAEAYLRRERLSGLGKDPDTIEVRVRPQEPERSPDGGSSTKMARWEVKSDAAEGSAASCWRPSHCCVRQARGS